MTSDVEIKLAYIFIIYFQKEKKKMYKGLEILYYGNCNNIREKRKLMKDPKSVVQKYRSEFSG